MLANPGCKPWTVDYISVIDSDVDSIKTSCAAQNDDQCKTDACIIEMYFYTRTLSMLLDVNTHQAVDEYKHSNGVFDVDATCLQGNGQQHTDTTLECCGEQPYTIH